MRTRNFVLTGAGGIVEVQGTAEGAPFSEARADRRCWRLARAGTDGAVRPAARSGRG